MGNYKTLTTEQTRFLKWILHHKYISYGTKTCIEIALVLNRGTYSIDGTSQSVFNQLRSLYLDEYKRIKKDG